MNKWISLIILGLMLSGIPIVSAIGASAQSNIVGKPAPSCRVSSQWCVNTAQKPRRTNFVENELLLLYNIQKPANFAQEVLRKYHLQEKSNSDLSSIKTAMLVASTNGQHPLDLVAAINNQQKQLEANTNNLFHTAAVQPGKAGGGYPLSLTGIQAAHQYTRGAGIKIGMIDTPIDITHSSLDNSKVQRVELIPAGNSNNQQHGTEVAGIMVSQNPRIGIAPDARLIAVSAFSSNPKNPKQRSSNASLVAKALDYCIRERVDVLNLSFAGGKDSLVNRLISKAINNGIVVVASAGNNGPRAKPAYPAAIPNVIAVTAIDKGENLFGRANRGAYIDLAAPGVDILTTSPRGSFNISTGTSLATAHVTGVVALLMSMNRKGFHPSILERTAVDLGQRGHDNAFGYGLVNVGQALNSLKR